MAGTVSKADKSFIVPMGPFKLEVIKINADATNAIGNDDTVASKLANPVFATVLPAGDIAAATVLGSCSVSGKTVTIHDVNNWNSGQTDIIVLVFGDTVWD